MNPNSKPQKKKPSAPARGHLGQQQNHDDSAAAPDFNELTRNSARLMKSWQLIRPAYFYGHEIPGLHEISKGYAWGYCPFCKEPEQTFCVNLKTGAYKCMAPECREEGGSMLAFARNYMGMDHFRAIRYLDAAQGEIA